MKFDEWFAEYDKENHGRNDAAEDAWDYQQKQIDSLRAFAQDIMQGWPMCGVDGGDLQDIAEITGG